MWEYGLNRCHCQFKNTWVSLEKQNNQIGARRAMALSHVGRICPEHGEKASKPNRTRQRSCPCTLRCCYRSNEMRWAENSPPANQPTMLNNTQAGRATQATIRLSSGVCCLYLPQVKLCITTQ